jgi:hypothetical protein
MTNDNDKDTSFMEMIEGLINEVFSDHYKGKTVTPKPDPSRDHFPNLYESIEDYTAQTGKRFRMTKEQKSRELTREQAFNELYLGDN